MISIINIPIKILKYLFIYIYSSKIDVFDCIFVGKLLANIKSLIYRLKELKLDLN